MHTTPTARNARKPQLLKCDRCGEAAEYTEIVRRDMAPGWNRVRVYYCEDHATSGSAWVGIEFGGAK